MGRYDRSLVDLVYDLLYPELFRDRNVLQERMNRAKRGRHFKVLDIFVVFLAKIRAMFNALFRTIDVTGRMASGILNIPCISYSRLLRRIRKLNLAIDSSGIREEGEMDPRKPSGAIISVPGGRGGMVERLHAIVSIYGITALILYTADDHGGDAMYGRKMLERVWC
ncbi:MAG: hypothetical protein M0Z77_05650 [Thermoplasmatales archaeon]|nr:hypothetical protein [Thermoplasmatales archaeon]